MERKKINISVKDLVDFSVGTGNIEKRSISILSEAAWEGTACHIRYQKDMAKKFPETFTKEVYLTDTLENEEIILTVSGRIDGLLIAEDDTYIYELKTTSRNIDEITTEDYPTHWGQAISYGYIYCKKNKLDYLGIRMVYINRETQESRQFQVKYSIDELATYYNSFIYKYLNWMTGIRKWEILRNSSIKTLAFPFSTYRAGQRELAEQAYVSIKDEVKLFVQAPTGIGKTAGTMFPAIKAMGEGLVDKIFYLTAKTVTASVAVETYKKMSQGGLNLRALVITAKDKVCPHEVRDCDPLKCERAKEYYSRSKIALKELLNNQFMDRDTIKKYADAHNICPFELSLDASTYSDLIICDYNYLFDPRIKLIRFFDEVDEDYCFLIDEAHNLVERGREMYSADISQEEVSELKKLTGIEWDDLRKRLGKVIAELNKCRKIFFNNVDEGYISDTDLPENLCEQIKKCAFVMDKYMEYDTDEDYRKKLMDLFFKFIYFTRVSEFFDKRYSTFYILEKDMMKVKMMCLDPSYLISKSMDTGRASVLFSATLQPSEYYRNILGGKKEDRFISIPSPFPVENLRVLVEGRISTRYRDRDLSYCDIARLIKEVTEIKTGNYMVYFPSYKYMNSVLEVFDPDDMDIIIQRQGMDEYERERFLKRFDQHGNSTLTGFTVMGGIFGEGIDLVGDKLSGVIIVGTGLPAVSPERELIKEYFDNNDLNGFDYAYTYPGLNRVLQAAGRVIRTEEDRGFVILIDSRFASSRYKNLYPRWWRPEYFTFVDRKISSSVSSFIKKYDTIKI